MSELFRLYWLVLFGVLGGNVLRLPLSDSLSFPLLDIFAGIFCLRFFFTRSPNITDAFRTFRAMLLWFLWFLWLSLIIWGLTIGLWWTEIITSGLYWGRYIAYASLFLGVATLNKEERKHILTGLSWLGPWLAILGFLQLWLYPDFTEMAQKWWDPHVGRLLSTLFDPNFLWGILAFFVTMTTALALTEAEKTHTSWKTSIGSMIVPLIQVGIMLPAIGLTYSRSSYLALILSGVLLLAIKNRKILILATLLVLAFASQNERLQERVAGAFSFDTTSQLRVQSWVETVNILEQSPVIGVGYNTLKYAQEKAGTAAAGKNSASGSESSLITILVTTGVWGMLLWLLLHCFLWLHSFLHMRMYKSGLALWFFTSLPALFVHSFFVNDFFYAFFLVPFWIYAGLLLAEDSPSENRIKNQ